MLHQRDVSSAQMAERLWSIHVELEHREFTLPTRND
jgi:hypothetical protein